MRFIVCKLHLRRTPPTRRVRCRSWCRLSFDPEKFFEKVTRPLLHRSRNGLSAWRPGLFHSAGGIGIGLYIGFNSGISHLDGGAALTGIGAFFVLPADVTSSVAH